MTPPDVTLFGMTALEMLNNLYEGLQSKSRYDDFSESPQDSLQYVMQAQAFVHRVAAGTTYAAETDRMREREPDPDLTAVLESMRAEAEA